MKYALYLLIGAALVTFVALTYDSQLLANITSCIIGIVTGAVVGWMYASDHGLDNRRRR